MGAQDRHRRTGADDPVRGEARKAQRNLRHDIHGIGRYEEDPIESRIHDRLYNRLEHRCVPAQEVYPGTTDVIDIVPSPDMGMLTGTAVQRITA